MTNDDIRRIERAAEIIALAVGLVDKCFRGCGRFSTIVAWSNSTTSGLCDECAAETRDKYPSQTFTLTQDLPQAKRARRLEQLLKGE